MQLVYADSGLPVLLDHEVVTNDGKEYVVTGWREPQHVNSTGRVFVKNKNGLIREFFPSVFGMEFND